MARKVIYYWSEKEKAMNRTPKHMAIKKELHPLLNNLSSKELAVKIKKFKEEHPDWFP